MAMGPPRPHVECIFGPATKGVVGAVYVLKGPFCLQRPYYYLSVKDLTGKFKVVQSTRWQELTQDIEAAASLSHLIGARTEFYLLNPVGAKPIIVTGKRGELEVLKAGLGQPWGRTPLAQTTERIVVG